jgi:NADP-dependent 3-hydroxy acid dehydrogenase YdfG
MNIAIKPENVAAREVLAGKVSLVTGSTSGIGLGNCQSLSGSRFGNRPQRLWQTGRDCRCAG